MDAAYHQISEERYNIIVSRYEKFQNSLDEDTAPVKVFDPLPKHLLDELELIREVSKDLQKKKVEDLNKAAQAAKQAEAEAKKKAEEDAAKAKAEETEAEKEDA